MVSQILIKLIDSELAWRESELALAKINLLRSIGDSKAFRFAYRCFAAMTCAHYEGFTKKVLAQAINDIVSTGVMPSACNNAMKLNFLVPEARKKIKELSDEELLDLVFNNPKSLNIVTIPSPNRIVDCGNLNYKTFDWAVSCVGIKQNSFMNYKSSINRLVNLRHECAHGDILSFDSSESERELARKMFDLQESIINLIHELSIELIDHFSKKGYL